MENTNIATNQSNIRYNLFQAIFNGERIDRSTYLKLFLLNLFFFLGFSALIVYFQPEKPNLYLSIGIVLFLIPNINLIIRRLNDINLNCWLFYVVLIPFVNILLLMLLFIKRGSSSINQYGAKPIQLSRSANILVYLIMTPFFIIFIAIVGYILTQAYTLSFKRYDNVFYSVELPGKPTYKYIQEGAPIVGKMNYSNRYIDFVSEYNDFSHASSDQLKKIYNINSLIDVLQLPAKRVLEQAGRIEDMTNFKLLQDKVDQNKRLLVFVIKIDNQRYIYYYQLIVKNNVCYELIGGAAAENFLAKRSLQRIFKSFHFIAGSFY